MSNLAGKFAIVTGAGKGIGAAIAKRFVQEQAAGVAIWEFDEALAKKTAEEIGGNVIVCKCDVSNRENVKAAYDATIKAFGRVDILINNAGITKDCMYHKMTDAQWDAVINVNLTGIYNCTKVVIQGMRDQEYGKIVNLASTSAWGNVGQANYAATKAGIIGFTKTLGKESARKNITVNAIAPGFIDTDMMRAIPADQLEAKMKAHPANRLGSVDELAAVAFFLASDDSSWVNGECIVASGASRT